ncbi:MULTISPECIES: CsbD family protein [unclassified Roseitalea]|uniref:CsbD family protein n=1 Tax=unclassified Roseitalea TaxID=2639107 RepID=UPI00273D1899|nr:MULTISPECIES: CsbD family protein [unclassified Roseitalea]
MNWDQVKGKWTELQGQAKQRWGQLTDDDLAQAQGDREELAGIVRQRYGKSKEEAQREVDDWMASLR